MVWSSDVCSSYLILHRLRLLTVAAGDLPSDVRLAGDLDLRLIVLRQVVPELLVDDQLGGRRRLVPAREVVVLGDLLEAHRLVDRGHGELRPVDHALLEVREDLAGREQGHRKEIGRASCRERGWKNR